MFDAIPAEYPWPPPEVVADANAALAELRDSPDMDWDSWRVDRERARAEALAEMRREDAERAAEGER